MVSKPVDGIIKKIQKHYGVLSLIVYIMIPISICKLKYQSK